jgi:hypothetical protein
MSLAVVYLIHKNDDITRLYNFLDSVEGFSLPISWQFKLLFKGFSSKQLSEIANGALTRFPRFQIFPVPNRGYDLESYRWFAKRNPHDHYLFLSSSSRLTMQESINILESVDQDSTNTFHFSLGSRLSLATNNLVMLELKHLYLQGKIPDQFLQRYSKMFIGRKLGIIRSVTLKRNSLETIRLARVFINLYFKTLKATSRIQYRNFPRFPNPHIRTTGFHVDRETFLSLEYGFQFSKKRALLLESGSQSILRQLLKKGVNIFYLSIESTPTKVLELSDFEKMDFMNVIISDQRHRQESNNHFETFLIDSIKIISSQQGL